jgi:putative redox protein
MSTQRVFFENQHATKLAGIIDSPDEQPLAFAVFAHCFTCTKDLKAIVKISRRLAANRVAVLRFDFTGLGSSSGVFADSNFNTNLDDVRAAVAYLKQEHQPPSLLIGHSLGGAAMMAVANEFDSVKGLATLASPSCTAHLADTLLRLNPEIENNGEGEVVIGGRTHLIRQQMVDVLRSTDLESKIRELDVPHLILHSPVDQTLSYQHAEKLFEFGNLSESGESMDTSKTFVPRSPKTLVTLDGSDHLLVKLPNDPTYVSDIIRVWASRYIPTPHE